MDRQAGVGRDRTDKKTISIQDIDIRSNTKSNVEPNVDANSESDREPGNRMSRCSKTSDCYNGADIYDPTTKQLIYSWSQSLTDLDVTVPLSRDLKNKNQCAISIKSNHLTVLLDQPIPAKLDGELAYSIRSTTAYWTLEPGHCIRIFLEKAQERWWNRLLLAEPSLDLNGLEKSIPYDQLSFEEQNVIQQLAYKQVDKHTVCKN